ncbi:hypothetical protein B0H14DRAFT_2623828 [Mycena olivaceomarginata]|nr:hypothetical protein B0H14DRAFT_2623828 [Mycena olivaceomarginata]
MGDLRLPGWAHIEQRRAQLEPGRGHVGSYVQPVRIVEHLGERAARIGQRGSVRWAKHRARWGVGEREALDEGFHSAVDRGPEVDGGKQAWKDIAYLAAAIDIIACGCACSRGLRRTRWRRGGGGCWYEGGVRGKGGGAASEDE